MEAPLRFGSDGTFKIMQITDLHWTVLNDEDLNTRSLIQSMIELESPDLIIFTGDVIHVENCSSPSQSFLEAVEPVVNSGIPWAMVFGNHDALDRNTYEMLLETQNGISTCLTRRGPQNINGYSNYQLNILRHGTDQTAYSILCLDSGTYAPEAIGGANWIRHDQVNWFRSTMAELKRQHGNIPALAFFHIPLPEYLQLWETKVCFGDKYENVGSARLNTGLFTAMVESGQITGTFVGHDHVNDYWGELYGIKLCYGRATGYNSYGREGFQRGVRMICLYEDKREFDSWIRLHERTVIKNQAEHLPE